MKLDYDEVIKLGFERTDQTDNVFYKHNGYHWFIVQLEINNFVFNWDSTTHEVSLIRYSKNIEKHPGANRMATVKMESLDMLKFFIEFLSAKGNKHIEFPLIVTES